MSMPYTQFSQLPKNVVDFLVSDDGRNVVDGFLRANGALVEDLNPVYDLVEEIIFGEADLVNFPDLFAAATGIPPESAKQSAIEFARVRLLPIADAVGLDVESALKSWGADPASFADVPRIGVAAPAAVEKSEIHQALSDKGAVFSDPIMQHRLELIAASYRDGVRTREQAIAVLMRSIKTGGLEMGEKEASDVLGMVSFPGTLVPSGDLATSVESPAVDSSEANGTKVPGNSNEPSVIAGANSDHFSDADAAEVAAVAAYKKIAPEVPELITDTKAAADRIVAEAKLVFPSGEIRTRFDHIIDARLRDVRDGFGTREKLEASVEAGGVGMSGAPLVAAMEMVESMDAMHHLALGAKVDFLKQKIGAEKAERAEMAEKQTLQDAQVMSQRYAEITGKAPEAHVEPSTTARTSVAIPAAAATEQRMQNIDTAKVRAAIEATKPVGPVVTPVMSAASIPATASGRPIVEDIRFERKLAGPVEELRMLTLSDFRRLSSDSKQATLRIRDKVELAAQEGYEHRIAAIKAWRESPLSQLYVAVSREALMGGKSIVDVLAERRAKGEDTLREDELHAVVELNGILRF